MPFLIPFEKPIQTDGGRGRGESIRFGTVTGIFIGFRICGEADPRAGQVLKFRSCWLIHVFDCGGRHRNRYGTCVILSECSGLNLTVQPAVRSKVIVGSEGWDCRYLRAESSYGTNLRVQRAISNHACPIKPERAANGTTFDGFSRLGGFSGAVEADVHFHPAAASARRGKCGVKALVLARMGGRNASDRDKRTSAQSRISGTGGSGQRKKASDEEHVRTHG